MKDNLKTNFFLFGVLVLGYFWLKSMRDQTGQSTLKGKVGPYTANPQKIVESIMPWVNIHPIAKEAVKRTATAALEGVIGIDDSNVIDADYRRV